MTKTVKRKVAKPGRKPRTRRVRAKKTAKIDARVEPELRAVFVESCKTKGHVPAKVLRQLVITYNEAVAEKRDLDGEWELRSKLTPPSPTAGA